MVRFNRSLERKKMANATSSRSRSSSKQSSRSSSPTSSIASGVSRGAGDLRNKESNTQQQQQGSNSKFSRSVGKMDVDYSLNENKNENNNINKRRRSVGGSKQTTSMLENQSNVSNKVDSKSTLIDNGVSKAKSSSNSSSSSSTPNSVKSNKSQLQLKSRRNSSNFTSDQSDKESITLNSKSKSRRKSDENVNNDKIKKEVKRKSTKSNNDSEEPQSVTRCVCGSEEDFGTMVQCETCNVWQHIECMEVSKVPKHYYCELCRPDLHPFFQWERNQQYYTAKSVATQDPNVVIPIEKEEVNGDIHTILSSRATSTRASPSVRKKNRVYSVDNIDENNDTNNKNQFKRSERRKSITSSIIEENTIYENEKYTTENQDNLIDNKEFNDSDSKLDDIPLENDADDELDAMVDQEQSVINNDYDYLSNLEESQMDLFDDVEEKKLVYDIEAATELINNKHNDSHILSGSESIKTTTESLSSDKDGEESDISKSLKRKRTNRSRKNTPDIQESVSNYGSITGDGSERSSINILNSEEKLQQRSLRRKRGGNSDIENNIVNKNNKSSVISEGGELNNHDKKNNDNLKYNGKNIDRSSTPPIRARHVGSKSTLNDMVRRTGHILEDMGKIKAQLELQYQLLEIRELKRSRYRKIREIRKQRKLDLLKTEHISNNGSSEEEEIEDDDFMIINQKVCNYYSTRDKLATLTLQDMTNNLLLSIKDVEKEYPSCKIDLDECKSFISSLTIPEDNSDNKSEMSDGSLSSNISSIGDMSSLSSASNENIDKFKEKDIQHRKSLRTSTSPIKTKRDSSLEDIEIKPTILEHEKIELQNERINLIIQPFKDIFKELNEHTNSNIRSEKLAKAALLFKKTFDFRNLVIE